MKLVKIVALGSFVLTTGCATVFSDDQKEIMFNSVPEGAEVYVQNRLMGRTPILVNVKNDSKSSFKLKKDGYLDYQQKMSTSTNPWVIGNVLGGLSGFFSTTTDASNGSAIQYDESSYFVTLAATNKSSTTYPVKRKIKLIIVNFNHELRLELINGSGENLDALLELLDISRHEEQENINTLAKLSLGNPDMMVFANTVLDFYDID